MWAVAEVESVDAAGRWPLRIVASRIDPALLPDLNETDEVDAGWFAADSDGRLDEDLTALGWRRFGNWKAEGVTLTAPVAASPMSSDKGGER